MMTSAEAPEQQVAGVVHGAEEGARAVEQPLLGGRDRALQLRQLRLGALAPGGDVGDQRRVAAAKPHEREPPALPGVAGLEPGLQGLDFSGWPRSCSRGVGPGPSLERPVRREAGALPRAEGRRQRGVDGAGPRARAASRVWSTAAGSRCTCSPRVNRATVSPMLVTLSTAMKGSTAMLAPNCSAIASDLFWTHVTMATQCSCMAVITMWKIVVDLPVPGSLYAFNCPRQLCNALVLYGVIATCRARMRSSRKIECRPIAWERCLSTPSKEKQVCRHILIWHNIP